jgi:DNA-directed RNA polymerase subunit alpha
MRQLLKTKLVDMDLSVRALNCLKAAEVETLADLVSFQKHDLLKFRNFGKKSLRLNWKNWFAPRILPSE